MKAIILNYNTGAVIVKTGLPTYTNEEFEKEILMPEGYYPDEVSYMLTNDDGMNFLIE